MKTKTIYVWCNIYGNYCGYVGKKRVYDTGIQCNAVDWLSEELEKGLYKLSDSSDISLEQVNDWRKKIGLSPL